MTNTTVTNALATIRANTNSRRAVYKDDTKYGELAARVQLQWAIRWASDPVAAKELFDRSPNHTERPVIEAAMVLIENHLFKARKNVWVH